MTQIVILNISYCFPLGYSNSNPVCIKGILLYGSHRLQVVSLAFGRLPVSVRVLLYNSNCVYQKAGILIGLSKGVAG